MTVRKVNRSVIDHRSLSVSCPCLRWTRSKSAVAPCGASGAGWMRSTTCSTWMLGVGGAGRHSGDLGAVTRERGVRQLGREEPEAPGPVLLDRGPAARVEVGDEAVKEVLGRGIERVRLRRGGLVGHGLGAADLVDPHHDRAGGSTVATRSRSTASARHAAARMVASVRSFRFASTVSPQISAYSRPASCSRFMDVSFSLRGLGGGPGSRQR